MTLQYPAEPLSEKEAVSLIFSLVKKTEFEISEEVALEMLDLIQWRIPHYIELMVSELEHIYLDEHFIWVDETHFTKAFNNLLNDWDCFAHWEKDLSQFFNKNEVGVARAILNKVAIDKMATQKEIADIAKEGGFKGDVSTLLETLVLHSYINNDLDKSIFHFNSPLQEVWWRKNAMAS